MATGFGIIDYIVVALITLFVLILLNRNPRRLLLWLPLLVTVDFFVPFGTQLTPSRFIPLILGCWLLFKGKLSIKRKEHFWLFPIVIILLISVSYSVVVGDAGIRPVFRTLHYLGLIFLFIFVTRTVREETDIKLLLWGLVLAGAVHGGYGLYQLLASNVGLPFRGIVYDESGRGYAFYVSGLLRVNGLADEPKRLGYILMVASLSSYYFLFQIKSYKNKNLIFITMITCIIVSFFTFSGSYYLSTILTILVISIFSTRLVRPILCLLGILAMFWWFSPITFEKYGKGIRQFLESRTVEIERGTDAENIYRQEFFARDYLEAFPETYLTGVGIGRYNVVFNEEYGSGAGYDKKGRLLFLNSQFYEILYDLGAPGIVVLYYGIVVLIFKIGKRDRLAYTLWTALIFLLIQSMTIQSIQYIAIVAGGGVVYLRLRNSLSLATSNGNTSK